MCVKYMASSLLNKFLVKQRVSLRASSAFILCFMYILANGDAMVQFYTR